ncbi:MAG: DNA-binding protein WhiA [Oscillospiraceae bacterium]|nr:DNA-binding protein WhiA [Oscillospiraceae bacterium]
MSFSQTAKLELCSLPIGSVHMALAETYGALLYAGSFSPKEIKIVSSCAEFAERLPALFKRAFSLGFDEIALPRRGGGKFTLVINDEEKIQKIFSAFGYEAKSLLAHHINLAVLEEDEYKAAFIRGAFLSGGSMTSPEKGYRLELVTDHKNVWGETYSMLLELGFSPRSISRGGNYICYLKQSEAIFDFLITIGASKASMELMDAKAERDLRNDVNRRVNCDSANADRLVAAAEVQLAKIRALEENPGISALPDDLASTAILRIANPESSLAELARLSDPPVSKSCISHRMRKLMAYKV